MSGDSLLPAGEVESIHFYICGDADNAADSFVKVKHKEVFKSRDIPYAQGVYDPHLGSTSNSWRCQTCLNRKEFCPGHFGSIDLKYPVQSPLFKDEIMKWLQVTCFKCGNLIVSKRPAGLNKNLLTLQVALSKSSNKKAVQCTSCGEPHPTVVREKHDQLKIATETVDPSGKVIRNPLSNMEIATILDRISDQTITAMGKTLDCHPRKFILRCIAVPPNTIRPDIKRLGGGRGSANDTTVGLKLIIDTNSKLPDGADTDLAETMMASIDVLNMTYFEIIKGSPQSSKKNRIQTAAGGKQISSIASHIPKKMGRVRGNLMGRRTTKMTRSVISCDPEIQIDEIGVPEHIARQIQIPITVHNWNIEELSVYFNNKDKRYPGCSKVWKRSKGSTHYVGSLRDDFYLEEGDVLYRDIITGDVMGFNRAPSLTTSSISSHRIRVLKHGATLRINASACNLYNADFDGKPLSLIQSHSTRCHQQEA